MGYLFILGTVLFTVYGQLILKWRIAKYGSIPEVFHDKIFFFITLLIDPYILSGFLGAFISGLFWMAAMTKFELSYAYPIIVGGLALLTSLFAIIILKESINLFKVLGLVLIIAGIFILNKG